MNYGYLCKDWTKEEKQQLAERLAKELKIGFNNDGISPYIEIDGAYKGVRIRRITHLTEEEQNKLITTADKIYRELRLKKKLRKEG